MQGTPVVCTLTYNTRSKRPCSRPETWKTWCLNQCPAVLWAPSEDRGLAPLSSAMNMELFCGAGLGYVFCLIFLPHSHFKGRSTQGFDFLICLATDSTTCMRYQAPGLRGRPGRLEQEQELCAGHWSQHYPFSLTFSLSVHISRRPLPILQLWSRKDVITAILRWNAVSH